MTIRIASIVAWATMLAVIAAHIVGGDWVIPVAAGALAVPVVGVRYLSRKRSTR